jgi:tRNA(Leu) C34 or U34 (ribose-2'-O)-methylase TrmL
VSRAQEATHPRGFAAVGLEHPKCAANLGGALRAAHCFGAKLVAIGGQRFQRSITDTTKAYRHVPVVMVRDVLDALPFDCVPVGVEFLPDGRPLETYVHPHSAFYVFGPEDGSVRRETLARCRDVIFIPSSLCLNLAAAVNVVLYDREAKKRRMGHHA